VAGVAGLELRNACASPVWATSLSHRRNLPPGGAKVREQRPFTFELRVENNAPAARFSPDDACVEVRAAPAPGCSICLGDRTRTAKCPKKNNPVEATFILQSLRRLSGTVGVSLLLHPSRFVASGGGGVSQGRAWADPAPGQLKHIHRQCIDLMLLNR
jgi:hypothetical protein